MRRARRARAFTHTARRRSSPCRPYFAARDHAGDLTPSERRVAELAAAGRMSRQAPTGRTSPSRRSKGTSATPTARTTFAAARSCLRLGSSDPEPRTARDGRGVSRAAPPSAGLGLRGELLDALGDERELIAVALVEQGGGTALLDEELSNRRARRVLHGQREASCPGR